MYLKFDILNVITTFKLHQLIQVPRLKKFRNNGTLTLMYVLDVLAIERYKSKIRSRARSIRRKCECHTTEKVPSHRQVSPRSIQSFNKTNSGLNRKTVKPVLSGHPREMAR